MATPSSQIVASWITDNIQDLDWTPLSTVIFNVVREKWTTPSNNELLEFVEENIDHVAEHLREHVAEFLIDGARPSFEIDNEQSPYIRALAFPSFDIVKRMRRIDPFDFEQVCAAVLKQLGAQSQVTQRVNDGGVDFLGVDLKIVPTAFNVPSACKAAVIGQAKRYRDGNVVNEIRLREFVGAAMLRRHSLCQEGKIGPLTPVLCAFWTTSDFDRNAKSYARAIGLWYMDGRTLADYVDGLNLRDYVMSIPEKQ